MANEKITSHAFSIADAIAHGVDKAVLLYNIRHWLEKNKANGTNARDGYYWTYNSANAFAELFPYMPRRSITDRLNALEEAGVLKSSQEYNRTAFDKTKWYTIPAEYSIGEARQSKGEIRPSEGDDCPSTGNDRPTIPDVNTDIAPDITQISKKRYGEFKNVHLTDDEHSKLTERMGAERLEAGINILDAYIEQKGRRYKSHFAVMKEGGWVWERVHKDMPATEKIDYSKGF